MLQEALKLIEETAVKAAGARDKLQIVHVPTEPGHIYYTVGPGGEKERRVTEPAPRCHELATVAEVLEFVEKKGSDKSVIWYDRSGVTIVVDDSTRRDLASVSLEFTPQFVKLQELERYQPFKQKEFVRLLRVTLAGTLQDPRLLDWVRAVKFTTQGNAAGQVRHGRESMGRDIDAQVTSEITDDCPEEVTLFVRVFTDPILVATSQVVCAVEIDASAETFSLTPLPLQLHNAIEDQVERFGSDFREGAKCPVFRGTPD